MPIVKRCDDCLGCNRPLLCTFRAQRVKRLQTVFVAGFFYGIAVGALVIGLWLL